MPGTADGTVAFRHFTVSSATCCALACLAHFWPAMTMFGLRTMPSSATRASYSSRNTVRCVHSVTS